MKTIHISWIFSAILLVLISWTPTEKTYTITGNIEGLENNTISLEVDEGKMQMKKLATGTLKNGTFSFTGTIDDPIAAYVVVTKDEEILYNIPIFLDKGVITLKAAIAKKYSFISMQEGILLKPEITGPASTLLYRDYLNKKNDIMVSPDMKKFGTLYNQSQIAYQNDDQEKLDAIENEMYTYYDTYSERITKLRKDFGLQHKNSIVGLHVIVKDEDGFSDETFTIEELNKFIDTFRADFSNTSYFKKAAEELDIIKKVSIGALAPDFTLKKLDGSELTLASLKGKYVLIDFWAYWCAPCIESFPHLKKLREKYKNKGFEILGVSSDPDKDMWKNAITKHTPTWPQVIDEDMDSGPIAKVTKMYNVKAWPTVYLIDKEGKIIGKNLYANNLDIKLKEIFGN